ncbi:MAG: helix-turn-helix domain-containing protein [Gaiellaceae bacterium]
MNPKQAKALGKFFKEHRAALGLSTRALAAQSGVDMATIVRLEQGAFAEPRPDTLRVVAEALGVSLADVFAMADYVVPDELPAFTPYLRSKYRGLPSEAVEQLERSFARLAKRHGFEPDGPAPGEDEQPEEQSTNPKKGGSHAPTNTPRSKGRRV